MDVHKNKTKVQYERDIFCFITNAACDGNCRDRLLGQSFVPSDRRRDPLQDEDHSGSRPHSFPGYYLMRSGRAPEWFRSGSGVAL